MRIYIDESGSFINAPVRNSWNTVVAYVTPESETRPIKEVLRKFKVNSGHKATEEIKLKNVSENEYLEFLNKLNEMKGVAFCAATDSGLNTDENLATHQRGQVNNILINKHKMIHKAGKETVQRYADKVARISPQLYTQLYCQTALINAVINRAINYFAARYPLSLSKFCWRVDQKNVNKNDYEKVFEALSAAFLQSQSFREPMITVAEYDYSAMNDFIFGDGEAPKYLEEAYDMKIDEGINIGKIMRDDFKFVDSKTVLGIQIADLLSAGFRRCLRGGFKDNEEAAKQLGSLLVHDFKKDYPVQLVAFTNHPIEDKFSIAALDIMKKNAKSILV